MFTVLTVVLSLILFFKSGLGKDPFIPKACLVTPLSQNVKIIVSKGKNRVLIGHYRYTVKSGDNLWSISRKFTVNQWMIREKNP
ncbi:LysM peptidoglycan-binding domain-containing protein [Patescibacteria group bacterium]|nr:LysM peptidoglycan-binding domain-containing protein [Patescibacteria group bacterium]